MIKRSAAGFLLLCLECLQAQPSYLGWSGTPIVTDSGFLNPAKWYTGSSSVESAGVTVDSGSIACHWSHGPGERAKYAQCYYPLSPAGSLGNRDLIGVEFRGTPGRQFRHVMFKLENGPRQASWTWENLGGLGRWSGRLVLVKKQFDAPPDFNWDSLTVVSMEVDADAVPESSPADTGTLKLRGLQAASSSAFTRATDFESVPASPGLADSLAQAILKRQDTVTGLFLTWLPDSSAWLYGQGLALLAMVREGRWNDGQVINGFAKAAQRSARFFAENQRPEGHWYRAWNARTGAVKVALEADGSVWMGDFPWIGIALHAYAKKSGDGSVLIALRKSDSLLKSLVDPVTGMLTTLEPGKADKPQVTSFEAYAAAILGVYAMGEPALAGRMLLFVKDRGWDPDLRYFKEGPSSARPVLLANAWLAPLFRHLGEKQTALDALSFIAKVLYTEAGGLPGGLDGVGPFSTWTEGTFAAIGSGTPGSQVLFDALRKLKNPDGTFPAYVDSLGSVGAIWAVTWSSLDASSWAYFEAAGTSPFHMALLPPPTLIGGRLRVDQPLDANLAWHPVPGVKDYEVWRSEDSAFANGSLQKVIGDTALSLSGLAPSKRYFWKIRSLGEIGGGDYSETQKLVTRTAPFAKLLYTSKNLAGHKAFAECNPGGGMDSARCGCDSGNVRIDSLEGYGAVTSNPKGLGQWINALAFQKWFDFFPGEGGKVVPAMYRYKALFRLPDLPRPDTGYAKIPEAMHLMIQYYDGRDLDNPMDRYSWDPAVYWDLNPWSPDYGQIKVYQNRAGDTLIPAATGITLAPDTLWHQAELVLDFAKRKYVSLTLDGSARALDTFSIARKNRSDWGKDLSLAITTESESAFPQRNCLHASSWTTQFKDLEFGFQEIAQVPVMEKPSVPLRRPGLLIYELSERQRVRARVIDAQGRGVRTVFDGVQEKGRQEIRVGKGGLAQGRFWIEVRLEKEKAVRLYPME